MAYYKINLDKLNEVKSNIKSERDKIYEQLLKIPYVTSPSSPKIEGRIYYTLRSHGVKVLDGYDKLINWLTDYINDIQEIESTLSVKFSNVDPITYYFGIFTSNTNNSSTSSIPSAVGGVGGVGGIISGGSSGFGGSSSSGGSTTTPNEEQTVTPSPYDEVFEKMKVLQDTKPLEKNIAGIENEIEEVKRLLEETTDPAEQEKLENKLEKLYKDLSNVNYELETLLIINGLQDLLKSFKSYDEYKAYIEKIQDEITELLRTLNSDKYTSVELLHIMVNENYDSTKPIYVYTDETGMHYSLEDPILSNPNAREVEKLTFEDINKKYSDNALFQEYKDLYIDNNGANNEAEKEAFANKVNELYDTYNEEKSKTVSELLDKTEEYDKHQRIVEYIESNAK